MNNNTNNLEFRFFTISNIGEFLIVDSSKKESTIKFIRDNQIKNLSFNQYDGFDSMELSNYSKLPSVKRIEVVIENIASDELMKFENIEHLYLSSALKQEFNLSIFKKLEYLNIEFNENIKNLGDLNSLKRLVVRKFNGNLNEISKLKNLEELEIIQGNTNSIEFIKELKNLKVLKLSYLKKLSDIMPISELKLNELEFDNCKKINYEQVFSKCTSLQKLVISKSSKLQNIKFLEELKNLKHFSFVETNVEDGDLTLSRSIDYVGFDNKKHYNHKNVNGKAIAIN